MGQVQIHSPGIQVQELRNPAPGGTLDPVEGPLVMEALLLEAVAHSQAAANLVLALDAVKEADPLRVSRFL